MNETPLPAPLEEFLQVPPSVPADPGMQESTLQRTTALLRKPHRGRRWPVAVAIAASVLVMIVAAYWAWRTAKEESVKADIVEQPNGPAPFEQKPGPADEKPKPAIALAPVHPRDLEWTAFDAANDPERVRLYFQAGDLYLARLDDYESALRCYTQALHYGDARDLEFSSDDNWLVMALKRDHRKEK